MIRTGRVFLTLYNRNLAPGEREHWLGVWEGTEGLLEEVRLESDDEALAWARERSVDVLVQVPHSAGPARYWAGKDPPPDELPVWCGRPPGQPAPTLFEAKRDAWQREFDNSAE
jgi:hypothetical protein